MIGRPCSRPRTETVAVERPKSEPERPGGPTSGRPGRGACVHARRAARRLRPGAWHRADPVCPRTDFGDGLATRPRSGPSPTPGSRPRSRRSGALRGRRSPTPPGPRRCGHVSNPANAAVSAARDRGLVITRAKWCPASRCRLAWSRPTSVSGMSVVPVWRPSRDHSVSPWRTSHTWRSGSPVKPGVRQSGSRTSCADRARETSPSQHASRSQARIRGPRRA